MSADEDAAAGSGTVRRKKFDVADVYARLAFHEPAEKIGPRHGVRLSKNVKQ